MRKTLLLFFLVPLLSGCGVLMHADTVKITAGRYGETVNLWKILQNHPNAEIVLKRDITVTDAPQKDMKIASFHIKGNGHTVRVQNFPIFRGTDVKLEDVVFDCEDAKERVIYAIGTDDKKRFEVRGCKFVNMGDLTVLCSRRFHNTIIEDCDFSGKLTLNSQRKKYGGKSILVYECKGNVTVKDNSIKNCFGTAIDGIGFTSDETSKVLVENNVIDMVSNGGIVFNGGEVWNVTLRKNKISNTHSLGKLYDGDSDGGPNAAINFHGYRNAVVEDNEISDCLRSVCFDFDGSLAGRKDVAKGTGLKVLRNKCERVGGVALFVVKDAELKENLISNGIDNSSTQYLRILGADGILIFGNQFKLLKGSARSFYPLYLSDTRNVDSGKVKIEGNKIETDSNVFVFVSEHFDGDCEVGENDDLTSLAKLTVVNNSKRAKVTIPKASKRIGWYR